MGFVQLIEFSTTRVDEVRALVDGYRAATEGVRTSTRGQLCADRDQANRYITIVEFASYEDAMKNSERPETAELAAKMGVLCDGPPAFRNLDVIDTVDA